MGKTSSKPHINSFKKSKTTFFSCCSHSKKEKPTNNSKEDNKVETKTSGYTDIIIQEVGVTESKSRTEKTQSKNKKIKKEDIKDQIKEEKPKIDVNENNSNGIPIIVIDSDILKKEIENVNKKILLDINYNSIKNSSRYVTLTLKQTQSSSIFRTNSTNIENKNTIQNKTALEILPITANKIENEIPVKETEIEPKSLPSNPNNMTANLSFNPNDSNLSNRDINININKINDLNKSKLSKFRKNKSNLCISAKHNISNFLLLNVIGQGTFGKVFLAKNKLTGNIYALKSIKKSHIIKTKNLKNLKNEKKILQQLHHPFITKLHSTFQDNEKVYLLMEYHNGGELYFHLQKASKFPEETVRFYAAQIYLALSYIHKHGIIYRDLKPENIVLDCNGNIKIIDFGLAKELILTTNSFCGTNEYIPPEVILDQAYSTNFDWWGFGIIIYEMLYGIPPFKMRNGNKKDLFKNICRQEPNYNKENISSSAIDLIKSLLKKDPCMRIKSEDIPNHPFFSSIDFNKVLNMKISPPLIPNIKDNMDTTYVDPVFLKKFVLSPKNNLNDSYEKIEHSLFSEF